MHKKEFENVSKLSAEKKYEYFIKKIVDFEVVWGLYQDGWALSETEEKKLTIPFWTDEIFARHCASDHWSEYAPTEISFEEFYEEWLQKLEMNEIIPIIMMDENGNGINVSVEKLKKDIEKELEKY